MGQVSMSPKQRAVGMWVWDDLPPGGANVIHEVAKRLIPADRLWAVLTRKPYRYYNPESLIPRLGKHWSFLPLEAGAGKSPVQIQWTGVHKLRLAYSE